MRPHLALLLCLALGACAYETPPPDTAVWPAGGFGNYTNASPGWASVDLASYVFANPRRIAGNAVMGARAVAALDYVAGAMSSVPGWDYEGPLTRMMMLRARVAVRRVVGIAPATRSQLVVDALTTAANRLDAGDRKGALAALADPAFTLGPEATLHRLAHLPYVPIAATATVHAELGLVPGTGAPWLMM